MIHVTGWHLAGVHAAPGNEAVKINEFDDGPLTGTERQGLRLLWAERIVRQANREAWALWSKIGSSLVALLAGAIAVWNFLFVHGGGIPR